MNFQHLGYSVLPQASGPSNGIYQASYSVLKFDKVVFSDVLPQEFATLDLALKAAADAADKKVDSLVGVTVQ